ncbi:MAG: protein-glutamate O-methyltransferase CheR [Deltaproteobacteria bacterium]|nr:protein-glutamate O-methyltransferase CheR [Deltaproteobacteria bacterium]MBW2151853.1 protein-glutamate O-methyltransferase CheR [Deltaproteobacteria bacterium]
MRFFDEDIELTDRDFLNFKKLVKEKCGIHLHDGKRELVRARIGKRLREANYKSFQQYYKYLMEEDSGAELTQLLNVISTNLTSFFRETNHFDYLEKEILPAYLKSSRSRQLLVWSAGCSSGEEAYSLAICFYQSLKTHPGWSAKIFATDISTRVLATAVSGVYHGSRLQKIPFEVLRKYFQKGHGKWKGYYRIKPFIRNMVDFRQFNLMSPFVFKKGFDIIFCRNVMIYFDKAAQETLINKFYDVLNHGGYLFIGHSESLLSIRHRFKYMKPTIYVKPASKSMKVSRQPR